MARGPFTRLRQKRRGIISWMIAALLLPVLIELVPQPALSAEAALNRAIAESLCGTNAPVPRQGPHDDQHQHCILCHAGAAHGILALPAGGASAAPHPQRFGLSLRALEASPRPRLTARRDGSPPTGPPAFA